ncbi:uncharacterized protein LOC122665461 [Telopea speciosissima]|uniref:uncharacterized protein LOC122665461 n=1 Tax=Telopea speciosissima TaxID=54955 RepID=UPI001CC7E8E3|nr:uncharacterized protein LOC122665461 [Telopea speciosissima]
MDFVTGLPHIPRDVDAIWIIVDRLTKTAHFITIKVTYSVDRLTRLYIDNVYGKKCRTPLYWDEVGERRILGLKLIQKTYEKVDLIRERIKAAQSRQKGYADQRRKDLEFLVGDKVFLKVSPTKGVMRFSKKSKLSPRYIGPYEILAKVGPVAYRLALPPSLDVVHDVFHISMLWKYVHDPSHILSQEPPELVADMSYKEQPEKILDSKVVNLRNGPIHYVKVKWCNHTEEEASWEVKVEMRMKYPSLGFLQDSAAVYAGSGYLAGLDVQPTDYDGIGTEEPGYVSEEHDDSCPCDDCAYGH